VESLLNIGQNVRLMVLKNHVNLSFPVAQLCSSILELEIVKTIIQIETNEDEIIAKLKDASITHNIKDRVITKKLFLLNNLIITLEIKHTSDVME
jgi:hypothetical protein